MSIWLRTKQQHRCKAQRTEANQGRRGGWLFLQGILSRPAQSPNRLPKGPSLVICLGVASVRVGVECKCIFADMPSRYSNAWERTGEINSICYAAPPLQKMQVQTTPTSPCIINEHFLSPFFMPICLHLTCLNSFTFVCLVFDKLCRRDLPGVELIGTGIRVIRCLCITF